MQNNPVSVPRPDVDIEEDVAQIIRTYSPLQMSRPYFNYKSEAGVLRLHGNVRTPQARRVLVDNASKIAGVVQVDVSDLHDDDQVRVKVGELLPTGVYATVHGGVVALTGRIPESVTKEDLLQKVSAVPGVRRVGVAVDTSGTTGT